MILSPSKKLGVVLFFVVMFISPLYLVAGEEIKKIQLHEVLSIGGWNNDLLFQWVAVVSDSEQNIYVTDTMDYKLKKFDSQGNLMKETGSKGQGPGEFLAPRLIGVTDLYLYVSDQYKHCIQVFDKELNFKKLIKIRNTISDLEVLSDNKIIISTIGEKRSRLIFYDSKGKNIGELEYSKKSRFAMDRVQFEVDQHGNYYLVYNFRDRIEKYNSDGKKLWSKKLLKVGKAERKKIGEKKIPVRFIYKDIELDKCGNIYILGGSYSKNKSQDVYVLDHNGKMIATFVLPEASHCLYIDDKDFLYSRHNDGITLKKYKMNKIY